MKLHRLVCTWQGGGVQGNAVTVLHFDGTEVGAPPVAAVKSAFDNFKGALPLGVTVTIPSTGDSIDDATGTLEGVWSGSGGGAITGTGTAVSAAGVGACITWLTGGIVNGRKLRGRTFLVPLHNSTYDSDGTLAAGTVTAVNAFAAALLASGGFGIWHRPTTVGGSDGTSSSVLAYRVRDKVAYLSSRRD